MTLTTFAYDERSEAKLRIVENVAITRILVLGQN